MAIQRSQLEQEVRELTNMFRTEDTFANVRAMLQRHSISPTNVLLAGLIENGDWYECGAVVLPDQRAFLASHVVRRSHNMVFTQRPLSLGESFGHERRIASVAFFSDGDGATPSNSVQAANLWYDVWALTSSASLWTGVVKTFR